VGKMKNLVASVYFKEEINYTFNNHEKGAYFTIQDLLNYARSELDYKKYRNTFITILKSMGYIYRVFSKLKRSF
jgi:hypothetical protein